EEYPEPMRPLNAADGSQVFLRLLQAPERVALGETFAVGAELENRGLTALRMAPANPVQLSYHLLGASGGVIVYDGLRSELFAPLAAGATAACRIRVEAPA